MNEDIEQEIKDGIEAQKNAGIKTAAGADIRPKDNLNMLQDVVLGMLPDSLKGDLAPKPIPTKAEDVIHAQAKLGIPPDSMGRPIEGAEKINSDFVQKSIRTYESDLAEALAKKQTSAMSISIAESKRKEERQKAGGEDIGEEVHYTKQIILAILGVIFIGGGITGGYYLYKKSAFALPPPAQKIAATTSIIPPDKQVVLTIDSSLQGDDFISQVTSQLKNGSTPSAKLVEFLMSETITDPATNKTSTPIHLTASSFLQHANASVPDVILRSLGDTWMLGAFTEDDGDKTLVMALTTDYFQNVFAGMLAWENTMPDDLENLFNYKQKVQDENANASSSVSSYFDIHGFFSDKVIRNRDVREFTDDNGQILLLYSFIDKQTLIITTTESAFADAIDRIEKETYVR